jgi:regulatory protein
MDPCEKSWSAILRRLSRKDYSKHELLEKVSDECKEFVNERLNSYFPNLDEMVLEGEIRRAVNHGKGPLYLRNRLWERKVSADMELLLDNDDVWHKSLDNALQKAKNKIQDKEKIIQYLLRQGFTYEMISRFMKEVDT